MCLLTNPMNFTSLDVLIKNVTYNMDLFLLYLYFVFISIRGDANKTMDEINEQSEHEAN